MKNAFLQSYGDRVNAAIREIDTYDLMGSSDTKLNLSNLGEIIRGAVGEIKKLQNENNSLREALQKSSVKEQ